MSNTPETDAAAFDAFDGQGGEVIFTDLARKLERERNSLQDQRDFCMGEIERLRTEIAECETCRHRMAVELLQVKNKSAVRQENHALKVRLTAALNERDEARNIARWLYQHGMATLKEGAYRRPWVKEVIQ